jgi:hypothetical protein
MTAVRLAEYIARVPRGNRGVFNARQQGEDV